MNLAIYTKRGKLRKNPPPKYVINGERSDENPNYKEWVRIRREHNQWIAANRI